MDSWTIHIEWLIENFSCWMTKVHGRRLHAPLTPRLPGLRASLSRFEVTLSTGQLRPCQGEVTFFGANRSLLGVAPIHGAAAVVTLPAPDLAAQERVTLRFRLRTHRSDFVTVSMRTTLEVLSDVSTTFTRTQLMEDFESDLPKLLMTCRYTSPGRTGEEGMRLERRIYRTPPTNLISICLEMKGTKRCALHGIHCKASWYFMGYDGFILDNRVLFLTLNHRGAWTLANNWEEHLLTNRGSHVRLRLKFFTSRARRCITGDGWWGRERTGFVPTMRLGELVPTRISEELVPTMRLGELIPTRRSGEIIPTRKTGELVPTRTSGEFVSGELVPTRISGQLVSGEFVPTRRSEQLVSTRRAQELLHTGKSEEPVHNRRSEDLVNTRRSEELVNTRRSEELVPTRKSEELVPTRRSEEPVPTRKSEEPVPTRRSEELVPTRRSEELVNTRKSEEPVHNRRSEELVSNRKSGELVPRPMKTCSENWSLLKKQLVTMYQDRQFTDFELRGPTATIAVHRAVLSERSPVFRAMLSHPTQESADGCVRIPDIDDVTLRRLVAFLYTDTVEDDDLEADGAMKLYYAADKYDVPDLRFNCSRFLSYNLSASNACDVLSMAERHGDARLTCVTQAFILNRFGEVSKSREWREYARTRPELLVKTVAFFAANGYFGYIFSNGRNRI